MQKGSEDARGRSQTTIMEASVRQRWIEMASKLLEGSDGRAMPAPTDAPLPLLPLLDFCLSVVAPRLSAKGVRFYMPESYRERAH